LLPSPSKEFKLSDVRIIVQDSMTSERLETSSLANWCLPEDMIVFPSFVVHFSRHISEETMPTHELYGYLPQAAIYLV
jgi:hypothetical protein